MEKIGHQQPEKNMWLSYLEYKNRSQSTRETSIHVIEIARAIKIIQESTNEPDRLIRQTTRKPPPTPNIPPKTRYKERKRSRHEGKEKRGIFLDQLPYKNKKITGQTVINTITNSSASIYAGKKTNKPITNHKPTEKGNNARNEIQLEMGDSDTRIASCNSGSEGSSNDSTDSNGSLIRRLKARTRAQRAWIESQTT